MKNKLIQIQKVKYSRFTFSSLGYIFIAQPSSIMAASTYFFIAQIYSCANHFPSFDAAYVKYRNFSYEYINMIIQFKETAIYEKIVNKIRSQIMNVYAMGTKKLVLKSNTIVPIGGLFTGCKWDLKFKLETKNKCD